ncbi:MAG TPA: orotidine-5'-phosphate decarboxylase [Longimicrobiales bacterium]|nr:orotidine-5'-phosphate decarboxylase [Longimicrobiales bacterium]
MAGPRRLRRGVSVAEVIVALDAPTARDALATVERLGSRASFYKVGLELFTAEGPPVVSELRRRGKRVFLDLKLHDIPNTAARAVEAAGRLGVELLTVHASGGSAMLAAARRAAPPGLRLLGVTVLTSLAPSELAAAWGREVGSLTDEAVRLAGLAAAEGLHGVVCSASEAEAVRARAPDGFLLVVPGIRPAGMDHDDQKRVATPADAVAAGADYLVVGRAVTRAPDPEAALAALLAEVERAAAHR